MTAAAAWSDTGATAATTVRTPLRSNATARPSGSASARIPTRPTSQLDSTIWSGRAGTGAMS